jgi:WD40 repeat protein
MTIQSHSGVVSLSRSCHLLFITFLIVSSCSWQREQIPPSPDTITRTSPIFFPQFEPISVENFKELQRVAVLGYGEIRDIALAPDGKTVAASSASGLHFYDTETGTRVLTYAPIIYEHRFESSPNQIAFSPDGTLIAVAPNRADAPIQIMSVDATQLTTKYELYEIRPGYQVSEMKFSLDGQQLFVQSIYSSTSPKCGSPEIHYALHDLSTNPETSKALADRIALFDNILFETRSCHYSQHTSRFTGDGRLLLYRPDGGYFSSILINAVTGQIIQEWSGTDFRNDRHIFDISLDGSITAVYSDKTDAPITLTNFENGEMVSTVPFPLVFLLDQKRVVRRHGPTDNYANKLGVWENGELTCTMDVEYYQAVDPTYSYLATSNNRQFIIWDIAQCKIFAQISISQDFNDIIVAYNLVSAFSSDNKYLALFSG